MIDCTLAERWLPVVGYHGYYEVSDLGRIRSVGRTILYVNGSVRYYPSQLKALSKGARNVPQVALCRDGTIRTKKVHQLVLEAFVGPKPKGKECCHANDNPEDNRLINLSWGTRTDNMNDRVRNGIHHKQAVTHCPEKHTLLAPNLVRCKQKLGQRNCLACARARGSVQAAQRRGVTLDFHSEAARHYRRIMAA